MTTAMENLQKCSKCKSEQELKYFPNNKKGQIYKACDVCREKRRKPTQPCNHAIINDVLKLMATATQQLESITRDEAQLSSDIENKSTTVETSSTPDAKYIIVMGCATTQVGQRARKEKRVIA